MLWGGQDMYLYDRRRDEGFHIAPPERVSYEAQFFAKRLPSHSKSSESKYLCFMHDGLMHVPHLHYDIHSWQAIYLLQ